MNTEIPKINEDKKSLLDQFSTEEIEVLQKILKLVQNTTEWVWLYRAEGPQEEEFKGASGMNSQLTGSWYTDTYRAAVGIKREREGLFNEDKDGSRIEVAIYAIVLPKASVVLLNEQEDNNMSSQIGREYLIKSTDFKKNKLKIHTEPIRDPNSLDYLQQFDVYRKAVEIGIF